MYCLINDNNGHLRYPTSIQEDYFPDSKTISKQLPNSILFELDCLNRLEQISLSIEPK